MTFTGVWSVECGVLCKEPLTQHSKLQIVGTSFEILSVAWCVWCWVREHHPECWMIKVLFLHTQHSTLQIVGTSFDILSVAWCVRCWMRVTSLRVLNYQNFVLPAFWPNGKVFYVKKENEHIKKWFLKIRNNISLFYL